MLFLLFITYFCFLAILFYYQKQEKIYIGYTTVLSLFFIGLLVISGFFIMFGDSDSHMDIIVCCLILTVWVLGSVMIYLTSQLTLAFEKIRQLTQHLAIRDEKPPESPPSSRQ